MSSQGTGFRKKILASAQMSSLRFMSEVGLRLISTIVLTRLLAPEVYGVIAVVMVYLYLLEMFSDIGLRSLVLTKEGEVGDDFLRTCWTVSILRGLLISLCSVLIGITIAILQQRGAFPPESAYAAAALPWAVGVIGVTALITGFQSPMRFVSERAMEFGRVTVVDVTRNAVTLIVTIALAFYLRSIWALVLGTLFKAFIHVVLSFVMFHGPSMRFRVVRSDLDLLIGRGKWIVGHSILTAIAQSADRMVLGFILNSSTFGFYFIARQLVDIVARFLESLNAQMGLQVFTHIQRSTIADFSRNYYRYRLFFDALAGLSTGGMVVLATLLVQIVFDDRYAGVAPMVQLLVPGVLLTGPLLLRSAFSAERRFKRMTFLSIITTATLLIGLAIGVFIFESVTLVLCVIAFHRLPEALLLIYMGRQRGWIVLWRESISLAFCVVGALLGLVVLETWILIT